MWIPHAIVSQVSSALWGEGSSDSKSPPELTPGITGLRLVPKIDKPDDLPPIEQRTLLTSGIAAISVAWTRSSAPAPRAFDWDQDNPYRTINAINADAVKTSLAGLVAQGYLAQDAVDAIDPSYIKPDQPCFMADPVLSLLGAEQYAGAMS